MPYILTWTCHLALYDARPIVTDLINTQIIITEVFVFSYIIIMI